MNMSNTSLNNKHNLIGSASSGQVVIWQDDKEGEEEKEPLVVFDGHTRTIYHACFSPDKSLIASASNDCSVRVWEISSGECIQDFSGYSGRMFSVSWSPNGRYLAFGTKDGLGYIYDVSSNDPDEWHCLHYLQGHSDIMSSIAWSMDSSTAVSSSWDKTIRVWDAQSGECSRVLNHHTHFVHCVSWSPDGKYLASCSENETVGIWDTKDWRCINTLDSTKDARCISWSSDGSMLACSNSRYEVWIWNVKSRPYSCIHKLKGHTDSIMGIDWNNDGTRLVSASLDKTVRVWDVKREKCVNTFTEYSWITLVVWRSPSDYYNYEKKKLFLLAVESAWNS